MKKVISCMICALLLVGCMAGCGSTGGKSGSGNGIKIMMSLSQGDDFRNTIVEQAKKTAQEKGATLDVYDEDGSMESQVEHIKQAAKEKYDVILSPAAPTTAPKIGDSLSDPLKMYLGDIYTISVNLAGLPGMSVPCGRDAKGLPIGLQLIGDCFKEKNIIRAAYAYEQTRKYEAPKLAKTAEGEAK